MKLHWILITIALAFAAAPATAGKYGRQVRFAGIHPVPKSEGGGICHIEAPHVHIYQPNKLEYRVAADNNVFVGDPVAYGWDGEKHAYKGHHPVEVNVIAGTPEPTRHYCYINGPHYHSFEPPPGPDFQVVGDAYFYVGTPDPLYLEARPQYIAVNATYQPIVYTRPVVEVEPPNAWILLRPGFVIDVPAAVIVDDHRGHGRGEVGVGVGVGIAVPTISVGVGVHIGGPAVIIAPGGGGHGKFKSKGRKRH